MSDAPLRVERRADGVVVLTLALPERRNAMTAELDPSVDRGDRRRCGRSRACGRWS